MNYVNVLFFVGNKSHSGGFWIDDVTNVEGHIKTYYPKATDVVVTDAVESDKVDFDSFYNDRPFFKVGSKQFINGAVNVMFEYDAKIEADGRPEYLKFGKCEVKQNGDLYVLYY